MEVINAVEQKKKKNKQILGDIWNTIKRTKVCLMGIPEGEERKGRKNIWRNSDWKHRKFEERHEYKHPRSSTAPGNMTSKRPTPRHIIIKFSKGNEWFMKASREQQIITDKWSSKRLYADLSSEASEARRQICLED